MFAYDVEERKCFVPKKKAICLTSAHLPYISYGISEHSLISWSEQFGKKDKIFLDIGAHTGTYSILLADFFKEVHSYEPDRIIYYGLCGSTYLSGNKNIFCHNLALGSPDQKEKQELRVVSIDGGESSILSLPKNKKTLRTEIVNLKTLDQHLPKELQSEVGFIKIDVEGNESFVIDGARETLKRSGYPPILFEANTQEEFHVLNKKMMDILKSLGYKIFPISGYPHMFLANIS